MEGNKMEFRGNIIVKGVIECETGLHIGGNKDIFEIGGIDAPVIRDPITRYPYIPGSSLKGRMRFLMEWETGRVNSNNGKPHNCTSEDKAKSCPVCRVFGISAAENLKVGPTRLIVRDAHPTEDTVEKWKELDTGLLYTEWKKENYIDRITSRADPRDMERVPKGSKFDFEMVYSIYDMGDGGETDVEFFKYVRTAMRLLEDSYLGGNGSRGYGKVKFDVREVVFRSRDAYREGIEGERYDSIESAIEKLKERLGRKGSGE
jgi:CRISPR-associated protein Csm3